MHGAGSTTAAIVATDIEKRYGDRTVLKDFKFRAETGGRYVICGANGSGKTTLVKILSTLVEPDRGQITVCGHSTPTSIGAIRRSISSYLFSNRGLWPHLSVDENLKLHARLFSTHDADWAKQNEILKIIIEPLKNLMPHQLSLGMRQLALIGRCLLRPCPVYMLDEPFAVLDEHNSERLVAVLDHLTALGSTVIVTAQSHSLARLKNGYQQIDVRPQL